MFLNRKGVPLTCVDFLYFYNKIPFSSLDNPSLTLAYLIARSNLLPNAFKGEIFWKVNVSKTVEAKVIILS